jgi:signal transduction histidine kinase
MMDNLGEYSKALILVVDDEATQRLLTRDTLEKEGFKVEEASNGEEGLNRIREIRPDLVLLDVMMPGLNGFEVCRHLRADPAISEIPVIIVTGREDTEDIKKGFDAGATDFLTKPVSWNLLPNRIRYVLRTSRLEHELRVAKEVAEKAAEAKSALLSTLGHELRTPLNAIIGFSDMMRQAAMGPVGVPQYEEFVVHINDSGNRLLNAINDILEIVSCESGNLELDQKEFGAAELMDAVAKQITPEAEASGVQIVNEVSDDGVVISGDRRRLQQALYNLVSNAVKFTEKGGIVRIMMTQSEKDGLTWSVADNGIGMSAEDLPRIMEPFEQADSRLARKYEGLGLGIPLARAMARLHGGDIDYSSELGKGTTARMTLPTDRVNISSHGPSNIRTA